jgi:hypothetical protein
MDLRVPSGWFFLLLGCILVGMGLFAPDARATLTDANVNLNSGIPMMAFGAFLLLMSRRAGTTE